jgi:hypothetical protein
MWMPLQRELFLEDRQGLALFGMVTMAPGFLTFLWAYLCDRLPIMGMRREGYLLVAAVILGLAWLGAALLPRGFTPWLLVGLVLNLGFVLARTAVQGALVELGRRHAAAGRLAAGFAAIEAAKWLLAQPLVEHLSPRPIGWTAGVGAALAVSIVIVVAVLSDESEAPQVTEPEAGRLSVWAFLRSRTFWSVLVATTLVEIARFSDDVLRVQVMPEVSVTADEARRMWLTGLIVRMVAAGLYMAACRRVAMGRLVRLTLVGYVLLGATALLMADTGVTALEGAMAVQSFFHALAGIAVFHLALCAAPRGREALGFALLLMGPVMLRAAPQALMYRLPSGVNVVLIGSVLVVALLLVAWIPRPLLAARDGEPTPTA